MTPEQAVLIGSAVITSVGSAWAAVKALSSAYRSAVNREAAKIEADRVAKEAEKVIAELKAENADLWAIVKRFRQDEPQ